MKHGFPLCKHTHTHTHTLSLSLYLAHTHAHTHTLSHTKVRAGARDGITKVLESSVDGMPFSGPHTDMINRLRKTFGDAFP